MASSQQTQQGVIHVAFEDGATAVYAAASGSILNFSFDTDSVLFGQQGEDLVITNANGDSVVIEDYITLAEAGNAPQVMLDNGITVAGDVFLFSVGQEETAADAAMSGGGLSDFASDPGVLFSGSEGALGAFGNGSDGFGGHSDDDSTPDTTNAFVAQVEEDSFPVIVENTDTYRYEYPLFPSSEGDADNNGLIGGYSADRIYGNEGNDLLWGDAGNDALYGGSGNDIIYGGSGDDMIYGGGGYDTLSLGDGEDVVVFNDATFGDGESIVVINDFNIGEDAMHLEGDATLGLLRTYDDQGYVEAVLNNGAGDNVIVRMEGTTQADFDAYINANPGDVATGDDQLLQYMAGNESAWV